jgi:hypothetical protein
MCGEENPLIKAHIIPRTFFEILKGDKKCTVLVEPKAIRQVQFPQAGDMDPNILCFECDNKFSVLDKYGFKILGAPQPKFRYVNPVTGNEVGSVIECDTDKLRRFVLAVLWRASISRRWDTVSLGQHEPKVLERIFDLTLSRLTSTRFLSTGSIPPHWGFSSWQSCLLLRRSVRELTFTSSICLGSGS